MLPPSISRFFRAMQAGAGAKEEMMSLFSEQAAYTEPFSGQPRTHRGRAAIREVMSEGWRHPLPEMRLEVERFEANATEVRVEWTCHSPALPGGKGHGTNHFTLSDGLIVRLVTTLR